MNGQRPAAPAGVRAILAYKLHQDGAEELIRDASVTGLDAAAFKDIVAVSNTETVYSANFPLRPNPFMPSFSEPPIASYVVPSLLFEDLTVQKSSENFPKPPLLDRPHFTD